MSQEQQQIQTSYKDGVTMLLNDLMYVNDFLKATKILYNVDLNNVAKNMQSITNIANGLLKYMTENEISHAREISELNDKIAKLTSNGTIDAKVQAEIKADVEKHTNVITDDSTID